MQRTFCRQLTDVHCWPSSDCIWNNRNSSYYQHNDCTEQNSCIISSPIHYCTMRGQ